MTALRFTRAATSVQAMRLADVDALHTAAAWMNDNGGHAWVEGRILRAAGDHGEAMYARIGQWLCYEPTTGFFDICDGDASGPVGHVGGLGVVQ